MFLQKHGFETHLFMHFKTVFQNHVYIDDYRL